MGKMTVTPELLSAESELVNLGLIFGGYGATISAAIDSEIESSTDYFEDALGVTIEEWCEQNDTTVGDEVTCDFFEAYRNNASILSDMLIDGLGDLATDNVVVVDELLGGATGDEYRDYVPALLTIDGKALFDAFVDIEGTDEIDDGYGHDGFYRTASDQYWAIIQVLNAVVDNEKFEMNIFDYLMGWGSPDDLSISFGAIEDAAFEAQKVDDQQLQIDLG